MRDVYAQRGFVLVTQTVANTLTFQPLSQFVSNIGQPTQAMLIHRVQFLLLPADLQQIAGAADLIDLGLSLSDRINTTREDEAEMLVKMRFDYDALMGGGGFGVLPKEMDFTALPGKGIIAPIKRLYGFIFSTSIAATVSGQIVFYFTVIDIKPEDYNELTQVYNVVT